jgi:hypothetical protein
LYEELVSYDESDKYPSVICPSCGSKKKEKIMSACNFNFANPVGTDRWNSEKSGHDYRFKHKLPSVIKERKNAEIAGKTAQPYKKINDLNRNDSWGKVK